MDVASLGDELPIFVWIVSAADAIDAMTSDRSHQQAMSFEAAVEQVRAGAGTQFHPDVADADLVRAIDDLGKGGSMLLATWTDAGFEYRWKAH